MNFAFIELFFWRLSLSHLNHVRLIHLLYVVQKRAPGVASSPSLNITVEHMLRVDLRRLNLSASHPGHEICGPDSRSDRPNRVGRGRPYS